MQKHTNTYEEENYKDKLTNIIKMICFMYLANDESISHITIERLEECFKFCVDEYESINNLKDALKVKDYCKHYEEIYSNLDNIIASDNLLSKDVKVAFIELTKDINNLSDTLAFCFGILSKIIKEKKI